jgi:hypothetical protein
MAEAGVSLFSKNMKKQLSSNTHQTPQRLPLFWGFMIFLCP